MARGYYLQQFSRAGGTKTNLELCLPAFSWDNSILGHLGQPFHLQRPIPSFPYSVTNYSLYQPRGDKGIPDMERRKKTQSKGGRAQHFRVKVRCAIPFREIRQPQGSRHSASFKHTLFQMTNNGNGRRTRPPEQCDFLSVGNMVTFFL